MFPDHIAEAMYIIRPCMIHFAGNGVSPFDWLARPFAGEQLQCRQNGSNLIWYVIVISVLECVRCGSVPSKADICRTKHLVSFYSVLSHK